MKEQMVHEKSQNFIAAITSIGKKVAYRENPQGFYPKGNRNGREISFEEVENMLMDELLKTELHYDTVGEAEFQRLLNHGIKILDGSQALDLSTTTEDEDEEEEVEDEQEEEEEEETPMSMLCEFISEVIEEAKANEELDEEYLHQRIEMGMKTRSLEVVLND